MTSYKTIDPNGRMKNLQYLLIRDNIRRTMASVILHGTGLGNTLMSDITSVAGSNVGDLHAYVAYAFRAGCVVYSPELVQILWDTTYVSYEGGKGTTFCKAEEWKAWAQDPDRSRPRNDILVIPMPLSNQEYEYISLTGEFDDYGYRIGRYRPEETGRWEGWAETQIALGLDEEIPECLNMTRTNYNAIEPACRNLIRGTVLGPNNEVWSSGINTFDGGDLEPRVARVRRGEVLSHDYTSGMFGGGAVAK